MEARRVAWNKWHLTTIGRALVAKTSIMSIATYDGLHLHLWGKARRLIASGNEEDWARLLVEDVRELAGRSGMGISNSVEKR